MGALAWVMMGLALWHFTIFLPDRFWGGIVGAFVGAVVGAFLFGFLDQRLHRPGPPRHAPAAPRSRRSPARVHRAGRRVARGRAPRRRRPRRPPTRGASRPERAPCVRRRPGLRCAGLSVRARHPAVRRGRRRRARARARASRSRSRRCSCAAGWRDPAAARAWLAADDEHDPLGVRGHRRRRRGRARPRRGAGTRITVHGDYDVDGVCSTAILVRALRALGADVDWYLPSRTRGRLRPRGRDGRRASRPAARALLITADCAITAVDEVAAARAAGMDVVVTDHHAPRADGALPDAPIVHPALCGYPCPELCAAGVAHKLARALLAAAGRDPAAARDDLDLVALATVADCVPLRGENRRLVREGLRALAATRKPGPARAAARRAGRSGAARRHGDRLPAGAAHQRRRAPAARRRRRSSSCSPHDEARAAEIADELDRAQRRPPRTSSSASCFEAEAPASPSRRAARPTCSRARTGIPA